MKKHNRPALSLIAVFIRTTPRPTKKRVARRLRGAGYTFGNAWFRSVYSSIIMAEVRAADVPAVGSDMPFEEEEGDIRVGPVIGGRIESPDKQREKTNARTLVFTCAQSNTLLHDEFFNSLLLYCDHRDAELHISQFTYNKASYGKDAIKAGSGKASDTDDIWYDDRIAEYVSDVAIQVTDDLVWCGELNIIPTRINPLSTFGTYTRQASAIIPHAKVAMQSIPTMKTEAAKMLYSTGACTQRNYIQKAAGQVADFHHVFGALVVEIDEDGTWWARQLNAKDNGTFYDLNTLYTPDRVITADDAIDAHHGGVVAITHGDIHWDKVDADVLRAVFETGGVVDQLLPTEQFFHDTIDFMPRNHHNIKDPHFLHEMYINKTESVQEEFKRSAEFLSTTAYRSWCQSFIVVSNHDQAVEGWLRNPDVQKDAPNARYWHELNLYCYTLREHGSKPRPFSYGLLSEMSPEMADNFHVLQEDDSYKILGVIEAGLHGHLGPNGARGTPKNLRTVGKANTAHTHSAGIVDGVYTAGLYGKLEMGYSKGLSGWSHSLIVTYANTKRAILTIKNGKAWRDQ